MKKLIPFFVIIMALVVLQACKKDEAEDNNALGGDPSPMGAVGTVVTSTEVPELGISNLRSEVVTLADGVSSYNGYGIVTNANIKNILSNLPGVTIIGDSVVVKDFKYRLTSEGVESLVPISPGIIVRYSAVVGDTYDVGSTGRKRTVVSRSTDDDYFYGFFLIKVIKIEEPTPGLKSMGVNKITYWANHRFGMVGVQFNFTDGDSLKMPVYTSAEN